MLLHLAQLLSMHIGQAFGDCAKHQIASANANGEQSLCVLGNASFMWSNRHASCELEAGGSEARQIGLVRFSHVTQPLQEFWGYVAFHIGMHGFVCSPCRDIAALGFARASL